MINDYVYILWYRTINVLSDTYERGVMALKVSALRKMGKVMEQRKDPNTRDAKK